MSASNEPGTSQSQQLSISRMHTRGSFTNWCVLTTRMRYFSSDPASTSMSAVYARSPSEAHLSCLPTLKSHDDGTWMEAKQALFGSSPEITRSCGTQMFVPPFTSLPDTVALLR